MRSKFTLEIALILLIAANGCAGGPVRPGVSPMSGGVRPSVRNLQDEVVKAARLLVGVSCSEGQAAPADFDCKRYIPDLYHKATGVRLPSTPDGLIKSGLPVTKENLKPGDIVYFMTESKASVDPGIYIGGGDFIHAPASGGEVAIQRLDQDYWRIRFLGARRILRGAEQS
jgi:cell wall-associated NlpC family hydrolase